MDSLKCCSGSTDDLLHDYPAEIYLNTKHNHPTECADALRHRRPDSNLENEFRDLFLKQHSPSSALVVHRFDMQEEYEDDFYRIAADSAKCPSKNWCYRLYYKIFKQRYGEADGNAMLDSVKKFVEDYNKSCGSDCASLNKDELNQNLLVAICSPLMKRVHENLQSSSEMCFIDESGTMDRSNTRVFVLLAPSVAEVLPLGIVMTFSESISCITKGLNLLKNFLPNNAFYGRGNLGPKIFMTDNSTAKRESLHSVYPEATLLLCQFHILQAVWRYILDSKNQVESKDRTDVFLTLKRIVYANSEEEFTRLHTEACNNPAIKNNGNVLKYFQNMKSISSDWALCFRLSLLTRGHNTNNYSEANFRVMKDNIMNRRKAFNVVQMFDFLTSRLNSYFERRLTTVINNRIDNYTKSRYFIPQEKLLPLHCVPLNASEKLYEVTNHKSKMTYLVNMSLEICSCPVGHMGAPCKHQFAVSKNFRLSSSQFLPFDDPTLKLMLFRIPTGSESVAPGWFDSLKGGSVCPCEEVCLPSLEKSAENHSQSSPHPPEPGYSSEELLNCKERMKKFYDDMLCRLESKPEKCTSESSIISAPHSFGKPGGVSSLRRGGNIPVQVTSVARRTTYLGGRSHVQFVGRPAKSAQAAEHGYSQKRSHEPTWAIPPTKKHTAPHSVSHCTTMNIPLGKTHSKKLFNDLICVQK